MLILPAVDIKGGRCVRLRQGVKDEEIRYPSAPEAMARKWRDLGARCLHVVDLDGAFEGTPRNRQTINTIARSLDIPIEVGGGIRDRETVEAYLAGGADRVVLGTRALRDPAFVEAVCVQFPGRIAVGIDAKDGRVAVEGWTKLTDRTADETARRFEGMGVSVLIYTDIRRDGMLCGPNLKATEKLARAVSIPVIASGGITTLEDIRNLKRLEAAGVQGAIIGRALYDGSLDFKEALRSAS